MWAIAEDRSGDLWVGTEGGGVARWSRSQDRFVQSFRKAPQDPRGLSGNRVRAVRLDRAGRLWVGTRAGGLDRIDLDKGDVRRYSKDPAAPGSLSQDSVYAIYEDKAGHVWIGTAGGLDRYEPETTRARFSTMCTPPAAPWC